MRLSIRGLRWVLLCLYLATISSLVTVAFTTPDTADWWQILLALGIFLGTQAAFIFGAGTVEVCQPIRKRRLLIPVMVAALMGATLIGGLTLALAELLRQDGHPYFGLLFWLTVAVSWLAWGVLFFIHCQAVDRYRAAKRMTVWLLSGSLVELLGSVPSHMIVSRRPGCFVGLHTMLGIIAGLWVMLWVFGPGLALLFLRDRHAAAVRPPHEPGPMKDEP